MNSAIITEHARHRIKERLGIRKSAQNKIANRALEYGISHSDVSGKLKRYIDKTYLSYKNGNNIKIYGDNIFVFHDNILLTVWMLPNEFKNVANKIADKKVNG